MKNDYGTEYEAKALNGLEKKKCTCFIPHMFKYVLLSVLIVI
jgi:hypothetical protein